MSIEIPNIMGVRLERFRDPIRLALATYQDMSKIKFDIDSACNLERTPDKPNSARSATDAYYNGDLIGKLFIIAFKPLDGTGDEKSHQLKDLTIQKGPYPKHGKIVPRAKTGIHEEAHLTIVTYEIDNAHAEPILFNGSFDLLGLDEKMIKKIGILGHDDCIKEQNPITTLTVGYDQNNQRFADPHAVFSNMSGNIQVCGFLAVTEEIHKKYGDILNGLNPQFPKKV